MIPWVRSCRDIINGRCGGWRRGSRCRTSGVVVQSKIDFADATSDTLPMSRFLTLPGMWRPQTRCIRYVVVTIIIVVERGLVWRCARVVFVRLVSVHRWVVFEKLFDSWLLWSCIINVYSRESYRYGHQLPFEILKTCDCFIRIQLSWVMILCFAPFTSRL